MADSESDALVQQVNQVLNKARDDAGRYAQASLRDTNNVVRMVTAGSKVRGAVVLYITCCSCLQRYPPYPTLCLCGLRQVADWLEF